MPRKNPAAAALGRRRWRGIGKADRSEAMASLASNRWADMTPEERAAEMKRRRLKGLRK